ncbi:hypothetical protein [Dietzia massiliensis]|uniref:hypothetical protein n=1 Tax=Dietzia massiliensis TaxID=2697499 RepID=UPI0028118B24|nr:hypothetical protein [Dietzia massiliensis]
MRPLQISGASSGSPEPIPEPGTHAQTVEFRLGDGSADVHLLLAGMAVAARRGLDDPGSLQQAERLNAADGEDFETLPTSCAESADVLEAEREVFEADGVFPAALIDSVLAGLRGDDDDNDDDEVGDSGSGDANREELIRRHWHVG